ncbi:hypothetical protein B5E43_12460 [Flavonifractor sp. An100]|nr:hypothetical protein B5E43_12460 [Flavonifractor sp. An100]
MTVDVLQQGQALCQALLLGGGMGLVYDLFRVLRVRIKVPLLGGVLDLLFWLMATAALFVWSQGAWGGQIRLYGAAFCLLGGGVYFWVCSPFFLWLGYRLADLTQLLLEILTFPLGILGQILKKIRKLGKNTFLSRRKWYRIKQKTKELERAASRRDQEERGERKNAFQAGQFFDQAGGAGAAHLYGHLSAQPTGPDPGRARPGRRHESAGRRSAHQKSGDKRGHRKQRRS